MGRIIRAGPQKLSPKQCDRGTYWPQFRRALVSRETVTLWLRDEAVRNWRALFILTPRKTQDFLASLVHWLLSELPVPHFATLRHRAAGRNIPVPARKPGPT